MMTTHARVRYPGMIFAMLVALVALLAATPSVASAATVDECQGQLTALRADTLAAAASFSNSDDMNGLVGKVDNASVELVAGKNTDAVLKLNDYQAKLTDLASALKPKVDPAVAATLSTAAVQAAGCISSIA